MLNNDILKEYDAVLRRKKFHLDNNIIDRIVNYFRTFGINKAPVTSKIKMPDEDDRVFYEVSLSIEDSFLVTGNLKHFPSSPKIISPADFAKLLDSINLQ